MLIGARMAMNARRKPYAYEVEYLEPTLLTKEEQYTTRVDTELSPTFDTEVLLKFMLKDDNAGDQVCSARTGTVIANRFYVYSTRYNGRHTLGNVDIQNVGWNFGETRTVLFNETGTHKAYVDGVETANLSSAKYNNSDSTKHLMLFAVSGFEPKYGTSNSRIYLCRIREAGELVRDFIPVCGRDGKGYMFDRISGRLFGNAGTGDFVLGPRVSSTGGGGA